MFVFRKIRHSSFSGNTRFEIRPFALLPTVRELESPCIIIIITLKGHEQTNMLYCVKKVRWRSFCGRYFPLFGLFSLNAGK